MTQGAASSPVNATGGLTSARAVTTTPLPPPSGFSASPASANAGFQGAFHAGAPGSAAGSAGGVPGQYWPTIPASPGGPPAYSYQSPATLAQGGADKSNVPTFMKLFAQGMEAQGNFTAANSITDLGNLQADFYRQEGVRQQALARLAAFENDKVGDALIGKRRTTNKGTVSGVGSNLIGLMDIDQERSFQREKILQGGRFARDRFEGAAVSTKATARNKASRFRAAGATNLLKGAGIGYGLA